MPGRVEMRPVGIEAACRWAFFRDEASTGASTTRAHLSDGGAPSWPAGITNVRVRMQARSLRIAKSEESPDWLRPGLAHLEGRLAEFIRVRRVGGSVIKINAPIDLVGERLRPCPCLAAPVSSRSRSRLTRPSS